MNITSSTAHTRILYTSSLTYYFALHCIIANTVELNASYIAISSLANTGIRLTHICVILLTCFIIPLYGYDIPLSP
ncbi:hypothetical protein DFP73DRAFT_331380 [Morchella snyderi]|nr:hypothetical protein DFP73DRAFT_331380 [Morchella snyderi]